MTSPVEVAPAAPQDHAEWRSFLAASNNGTLFHDLDFLGYHPPGRFEFLPLIFRVNGRTRALLPGGLVTTSEGERLFRSPLGASVGGLVLPVAPDLRLTTQLVASLQAYAASQGWTAVELCLPPPVYGSVPDDSQAFALMAGGFTLQRRWLCHLIPLPATREALLAQCDTGRLRYVRAAVRAGVTAREVGKEAIPGFHAMLLEDRRKFLMTPTHTAAELLDLFARVPGRIRLFTAEADQKIVAALLLLQLNPRVANSFYLCQDPAQTHLRATPVVLLHVMEMLQEMGVTHLDLGPTTFDDFTMNAGLADFKEDFGGRGWCRDAWSWRVPGQRAEVVRESPPANPVGGSSLI